MEKDAGPALTGHSLDPSDWPAFRAQAHRMLDDILDYVENIRERPVWQPIPEEARSRFHGDLPEAPSDLAAVHAEFMRYILPFSTGNVHPGFMGWVHGGGTPVGMLAEMLAAGLNANLGGRDHIPIEVERQIVHWMQRIFGFPESSTGLFVTGTSMANLIGVLIARDAALGFEVRTAGVAGNSKRLTAYTSAAAHSCVAKAMDISGIGSDALRLIPVDSRHRIDLAALEKAIEADRRARLHAVPGGGDRRHGRYRRHRRTRRAWQTSAIASGSGSTSTAHAARWRCWLPIWRRGSRASSAPIRWRSIFISGGRRLTTPDSFWCAMACCIAKRSPRRLPICEGNCADWPPARPGPAITGRIFRAAFAR